MVYDAGVLHEGVYVEQLRFEPYESVGVRCFVFAVYPVAEENEAFKLFKFSSHHVA